MHIRLSRLWVKPGPFMLQSLSLYLFLNRTRTSRGHFILENPWIFCQELAWGLSLHIFLCMLPLCHIRVHVVFHRLLVLLWSDGVDKATNLSRLIFNEDKIYRSRLTILSYKGILLNVLSSSSDKKSGSKRLPLTDLDSSYDSTDSSFTTTLLDSSTLA